METQLVEKRRESIGKVRKLIGKKRCKRRMKRESGTPLPITLQKLFVSCREVFKGPGTVPSPSDVQSICRMLDHMKPEAVGLHGGMQFFKPKNDVKPSPRVTYTTIYKCKNFSLCIFFLPATAVIPLHNHPGMTVFSKLLVGTMHIKSYDWADPIHLDCSMLHPQVRLARLKENNRFTAPCSTSVLYPTTGGNIHAFTAITPCAVLDVLGPPYSKDDGRDCTYYKDFPFAAFPNGEISEVKERDSYGWLGEIEMPDDSQMDGIEYLGPQIVENET